MLVMFIAVYNIWVKVGSTNLRLQTFQSRPFSGMSSVIINPIVYHWQIQRGAKGPPSPNPPLDLVDFSCHFKRDSNTSEVFRSLSFIM